MMMRALANTAFRARSGVHLQRYAFGGAAAKPYDWRDDHALNPFYELDPRTVGNPDPFTYAEPFDIKPVPNISAFSPEYNPKDLTQNYRGTYRMQSVSETNLLDPAHQIYWNDISHEWDYESEDLDFQPETFKSQHFRKKGSIWIWAIVAMIPYWYVIQEVIYHQMVDGDQNKYQRPPPLNYPDEEDTPDT